MIDREEMLGLTRRMNVSRCSFTRIAGCYVDGDGDFDGSFNTNFLNLTDAEKAENIEIAKCIPFADTNRELVYHRFEEAQQTPGSIWKMLMALRKCGLRDDALLDLFYDHVMEHYESDEPYAVMLFHDRYDVPRKAADKERLGESEDMFEYIICAICLLKGEYTPGEPECGFLFPAFTDGCADLNHIDIFNRDTKHPHRELAGEILGVKPQK